MSGRNPTLLFVEDDENDVMLVTRAFEKSGIDCRIINLETSRKAVDYLSGSGQYADRRQFPLPKLVLLDLKLIGSSGFEVLEWLKDRPDRKQMPVVVFSSSWVDTDRERARVLGADDYMIKPNGFSELRKVAELLHERWLKV